jgi:hypothetical protein
MAMLLTTQKSKKRVFISFDYDHDSDLKTLLVGQAKNEDSPFEISDWSVKEELSGDWKEKAREKIRKVGVVIVICGEHTDTATGVNAELKMALDEKKDYFFLKGRSDKTCVKPKSGKDSDKIYKWTWDNLKLLINGER